MGILIMIMNEDKLLLVTYYLNQYIPYNLQIGILKILVICLLLFINNLVPF